MIGSEIAHKIVNYFNVETERDEPDRVHENIVKEIAIKGTNLWILMFAIIVASVGLNMNSTAVIIGAMLISPLMGPINGMGYSIATYNFELFRTAVKNFGFAVLSSLIASTLYFAVSPVSTAHSELLARTTPTIYDVLIALFGGLAGIVAMSSKHKGNVIPGVAIATALMPPLCTAGYGLATGQFPFFFGALYLFTINTVFIALASLIVSQILKYPIRTLVDPVRKKRVNQVISTVIILVLVPSIFFGYGLVQKEKFTEKANSYIANVSAFDGNYLLKSMIDANERKITLVYAGESLDEEQKNTIMNKASDFGIVNAIIEVKQGLSVGNGDKKVNELILLKEELNRLSNELTLRDQLLDSIEGKSEFGRKLLNEISPIYPEITGCVFSESQIFSNDSTSNNPLTLLVFTVKKPLSTSSKEKIEQWLAIRLQAETKVKVLYELED